MQSITWFLVSDASRAKLFEEKAGKFKELEDMVHVESARHAGDLISDSRGRRGEGGGSRPGLSAATEVKEAEAQKFARRQAGVLKRGLNENRFGSLVIIAPPHHLGLLRQALDPEVGKRVTGSFHRDYINLPLRELVQRLGAIQSQEP